MTPSLKPLNQQTIVITGASSGIGLETACRAAMGGARVFLIARNEDALKVVCEELTEAGAEADYYAADMGIEDEVEAATEAAIARFGGFDTWVNAAGVGAYQHLDGMTDADHRRLFDTNYFGVVHGCRAAAAHLAGREGGGALITVGSVLSDMALPMMGAYSASKHAVKGYIDALRMELLDAPVSVTLIKPSSVDTPFASHALNAMDKAARVVPPVYKPEAVARAILSAAQHRHREITVGAGGAIMGAVADFLPRFSDRLYGHLAERLMRSRTEGPDSNDSLHAPGSDGRRRGEHEGVIPVSPYTRFQTTRAGRLAAGLFGVAVTAMMMRRYAIKGREAYKWVSSRHAPAKETRRAFFG